MPRSTLDPQHVDHFRNYSFRVKWDGRYVAGFSHLNSVERSLGGGEDSDDGRPSSSPQKPGRILSHTITLKHGVVHDEDFKIWATQVRTEGFGLGARAGFDDSREGIILEHYDETGCLVIAYRLHRCRVSELHALPDLHSSAFAVACLRLEGEVGEPDVFVAEPRETNSSDTPV